NSTEDFTDQPKVGNGASDLMVDVFGDAVKHTRSAVGVPALQLGAGVEVDAIIALHPALSPAGPCSGSGKGEVAGRAAICPPLFARRRAAGKLPLGVRGGNRGGHGDRMRCPEKLRWRCNGVPRLGT